MSRPSFGLGSFHASIPFSSMPPHHHLSSRIWYRVSVSLCAHYPVSSHHYPLLFIYGSTRAFSPIVISMLRYRYPRSTVLSFHAFRPPSSSVQHVVTLSSPPRCLSPLESSFLRPPSSRLPRLHVHVASLASHHPSTSLVALVIYTLDKVVMPFVGRHLCVSFFVLALLGVSCTLCSRLYRCLSRCSTFPIFVVAYRLTPIACRLSLFRLVPRPSSIPLSVVLSTSSPILCLAPCPMLFAYYRSRLRSRSPPALRRSPVSPIHPQCFSIGSPCLPLSTLVTSYVYSPWFSPRLCRSSSVPCFIH